MSGLRASSVEFLVQGCGDFGFEASGLGLARLLKSLLGSKEKRRIFSRGLNSRALHS